MILAHPILTCAEAGEFEAAYFAGDETREWEAMQRAGRAVAAALLRDYEEIGGFPPTGRVLVLAGKGHNAGDALIAAHELAGRHPRARIEVLFVFGQDRLRPLAGRAWRDLTPIATEAGEWKSSAYDLVIDGLFGFQFRPPLEPRVAALLAAVNALPVRLRAAVDLPSGCDEPGAFAADFTYATGIVKKPLLTLPNAGRLRYIDLGFEVGRTVQNAPDRVLAPALLDPLRSLRSPRSDKRTYGHVFLVGGSLAYPGAILMATRAALRSGAGLVTAFVPESLVPAFAAQLPEAMWVGWPETPAGGLALEGLHLLRGKLPRASSLVLGPGLGRERETLALAREIVALAAIPLVIDADALQPEIVAAGTAPRVLTPHAGELDRIAKAIPALAVTVRKGPVTNVFAEGVAYHSFAGGPVLARGGSGDVLAGLTGGLLAQTPTDPVGAAARGVLWHGLAADALARAQGQVSVQTTQLLDFLPVALRS